MEPLDKSSALAQDLVAFAPGTSREAVADTVRGLGLALRVDGSLYPVRDTAYRSLLERAKLAGSVLPKLSRPPSTIACTSTPRRPWCLSGMRR